jgi:hypothetical protein
MRGAAISNPAPRWRRGVGYGRIMRQIVVLAILTVIIATGGELHSDALGQVASSISDRTFVKNRAVQGDSQPDIPPVRSIVPSSDTVPQDTVGRADSVVSDTSPPKAPRDTTALPDSAQRSTPSLPQDAALSSDTTEKDSVRSVNRSLLSPPNLGLLFDGRFEFRGEKNETNRCERILFFPANTGCRSGFSPLLNFQYAVRSNGIVADRLHVDIDYDSQREFDASNRIAISYKGLPNQFIQNVELGNVTFELPTSRFISGAIPLGNYGLQTTAKLGSARLRTILAQQKGNIIRDRVFTIGDQTFQTVDRTVEDYQFEPRRFFFTVDPRLFAGYPNIDILNRRQMSMLSQSLPDTLRPVRLYVYRLLIGGQPPNPNGPQFRILGDPRSRRGEVYEYLREGVDYYADPSLLWISLVRPLSLNNERLVVAYKVRINGVETVYPTTGGTPDLEFEPSRDQFANLLWDPRVQPGDPAFYREIRSVYRLGGGDVVRQSVDIRIIAGSGGDQEKPVSGAASTYLQLFGLSQSTNPSAFDVNNRLWPRPTDPNLALGAGALGQSILRDRFLVFPSVQPFARAGLAGSSNPNNDTLYTTPSEYLNSSQRPQAVYHIRMRYETQGSGADGTLLLGAVQLRPNSERILVDRIPLVRGVDYTIDYDLGQVRFSRPDTLFPRPRQVSVQFEEIPFFVETPVSIFGSMLEFPLEKGELTFMALSQSQRSPYTRPPLGLEAQSIWLGGMSTFLSFDANRLTNLVSRLPYGPTKAQSRVTVNAEFVASKPNPNKSQQAYIESFEGEGGLPVRMDDQYWYYSSQPAAGTVLLSRIGPTSLDLDRATTLAWQSNVLDSTGRQIRYSIEQIDPQSTLVGGGVAPPEQLLWLTLYPLSIGGLRQSDTAYNWNTGVTLNGRRWRSIRTPLSMGGSAGADISRAENIEFWALIRTDATQRSKNPTIVFDVGEISENSIVYSPDTVILRTRGLGALDTLFLGRRLQGLDQLNSERDPFSRTFNATINDIGLPGDVATGITVITDTVPGLPPQVAQSQRFVTCNKGLRILFPLGDSRANCTVGNQRLDEEDLDGDNVLNFTSAERNLEQWRRYIVDLSDEQRYNRIGHCVAATTLDPTAQPSDSACWVFFRIPFRAPDDTLGTPLLRRARALRITVVSGAVADDEFSRIALGRLRFTGAPWLKRDDAVLRGIGGEMRNNGFVITGTVGTQDKNVRNGIDYVSPPGVTDVADSKIPIGSQRIQVNERSLRLTAGGLNLYDRAEAYYRFPEGQKNFMGYNELRVWARGVSNGWGEDGELQFYFKIGRDASNFYLYRTPLNGGDGQAGWLPEIRIDFNRFYNLRAKIQTALIRGLPSIQCQGLDSILIANTPLPPGVTPQSRYAACEDGYIVYTIDPGINAPNLAAVQELAAGMIRVSLGGGLRPINPTDTLELWVDDIRLGGVEASAGFAGQIGVGVVAGDFAELHANVMRRDPNFRQLGEQPTYLNNDAIDVGGVFHLERFFPKSLGYEFPVTFNYSNTATSPLFLSGSDLLSDAVPGLRTPRAISSSVTIGVKRAVPLERGFFAPLINNLALTSTYTTVADRSEYNDGHAHNFNLGISYNVSRALGTSFDRLLPSEIVLHTMYERGSDRTRTYLKPGSAFDDTARIARSFTHNVRAGGSLTFQPLNDALLHFNVVSLRDLRDYSNFTPVIGVAPKRDHLMGFAFGMERSRNLGTEIAYTPRFTSWLRARLSASSSYTMLRDPNLLTLVPFGGSVGNASNIPDEHPGRIPFQLGNEQTTVAGITIDLPAYARSSTKLSGFSQKLLNALQPIDISVDRYLLSTYDLSSSTPSLQYQFGLGGISDFLRIGNQAATSAGVSTQISITQNILLPFGATLSNRYQRLTLRNWMLQVDNTQGVGDGTQQTFPDIGLRWNFKPSTPNAPFTAITATARWVGTKQLLSSPGEFIPASGNNGETRIYSYPFSVSTVWLGERPVTTSFGATITRRVDNRAGASGRGNIVDVNAEIARAFALPTAWHPRSDLRTRLTFQNANGQRYVLNPLATGLRSRLTDNGRRVVALTADTDVAENLSSSFVISRVASFDRNLNRKFTQTVLSAVLHLQFFAGDMK